MPVFQIYAKENDSGRERLMAVSEGTSAITAVNAYKDRHPHVEKTCALRAVKVAS